MYLALRRELEYWLSSCWPNNPKRLFAQKSRTSSKTIDTWRVGQFGLISSNPYVDRETAHWVRTRDRFFSVAVMKVFEW